MAETNSLQPRLDAIGAYLWEMQTRQNTALLDNLVEIIKEAFRQAGPNGADQILSPIESAISSLRQLEERNADPELMIQAIAAFWQALSPEHGSMVQAGMDSALEFAEQEG